MEKNKVLDLSDKLLDKAIKEWSESVLCMSPEDLYIQLEEIREVK
jgi:hypothetical protein